MKTLAERDFFDWAHSLNLIRIKPFDSEPKGKMLASLMQGIWLTLD